MKIKTRTTLVKTIPSILFATLLSSHVAIATTSQQREYYEISDDDITSSIPLYGGDDISYSSDDNLDKDDLKTKDLVLYSDDSESFNLFIDMSDASNIKEFETVITSGIYVVQNKEKGKPKGKKRKKNREDKDENLDNDIMINVKYNNGRVTVEAPTVTNIVVYTVDFTILNVNDRETKPERPFTVTVYPATYKVSNASVAEVMLPSSTQAIETIADYSPILSEGFRYDFSNAKISATFESAGPNSISNEVATSLISNFTYENPANVKYQMEGNDQSPILPGKYTVTVEGKATPTLGGLNPTTVTLTQTIVVKANVIM